MRQVEKETDPVSGVETTRSRDRYGGYRITNVMPDGVVRRSVGQMAFSNGETMPVCYIEDIQNGVHREISVEQEESRKILSIHFALPGDIVDDNLRAAYDENGILDYLQYHFVSPEEIVTLIYTFDNQSGSLEYDLIRRGFESEGQEIKSGEIEKGTMFNQGRMFYAKVEGPQDGNVVFSVERLVRWSSRTEAFARRSSILPGFGFSRRRILFPSRVDVEEFHNLATIPQNIGWEKSLELIKTAHETF